VLLSNRFGCYCLDDIQPELRFTLTLQSNNLIPDQKYSLKQEVMYRFIKYLHDVEGLGYRKISKKLNQWGIKTQRGKKWFNTSVSSVLKRRKQRDMRISQQRLVEYPPKIGQMEIKYSTDQ
tara:strand:- start:164 stop:526 length:363 start_codon:yes stop_codon:yes gene_type:complete